MHSRNKRGCHPLAEAARLLIELPDRLSESLVSAAMGPAAGQSVEDYVARKLCIEYVSRVSLPYEEALKKSARALRMIGIALCAIEDNLNNCECLNDLANEVGTAALDQALTSALEEWPTR